MKWEAEMNSMYHWYLTSFLYFVQILFWISLLGIISIAFKTSPSTALPVRASISIFGTSEVQRMVRSIITGTMLQPDIIKQSNISLIRIMLMIVFIRFPSRRRMQQQKQRWNSFQKEGEKIQILVSGIYIGNNKCKKKKNKCRMSMNWTIIMPNYLS